MATQHHHTPIILHITFHTHPSRTQDFLTALSKIHPLVLAEPNCLSFEVLRDKHDESTIVLLERWDGGWDWFINEQTTKEYYKPYFHEVRPMLVGEREVRLLKGVEGVAEV